MSENNESSFAPQSDEALARLLEEQMRVLRGGAPTPAAAPTSSEPVVAPVIPVSEPVATPTEVPASEQEEQNDDALDALFGSLLDESAEPTPITPEPVIEPVATVSYESLDHTQPITFVEQEPTVVETVNHENTVSVDSVIAGVAFTAAVTSEPVGANPVAAEEVSVAEVSVPEAVPEVVPEDAHSVAERVLTEIGEDGAVYAPIPAAAAVSDPVPVPQMFGNTGEVTVQPPTHYVPQDHAEVIEAAPESQSQVDEPAETNAQDFTLTMKSVSTQPHRPSFDELVFGESPAE